MALRSEEQEPDPETEVYITDNPSEFGLWYRLSPITFMGAAWQAKAARAIRWNPPPWIGDPVRPAAGAFWRHLWAALVRRGRRGRWDQPPIWPSR